jgi:hypothetical protein
MPQTYKDARIRAEKLANELEETVFVLEDLADDIPERFYTVRESLLNIADADCVRIAYEVPA